MGGKNHDFGFLGVLKQPNPSSDDDDKDEFTEDDVVWSFFESSYPISSSPPFNSDNQFISTRRSIFIPTITDNNNNNHNNNNGGVGFRQSAPVNVPIWNNEEFGRRRLSGDDLDDGEMVPPHVIVARSHTTLSVFEGLGRTLKGRDARRVRNAVFQKTGFID